MDFDRFLLYCAVDLQLAPLVGEVRAEWGADHQGHRLQIKKAAANCVHASISHCPMRGGYIGLTDAHPSRLQVGLDLEEIDRVAPAAAARVASPRDHGHGALTPARTWSAREAAFKALKGDCQPQVVSQIALTDWDERPHGILRFRFQAMGVSAGDGFLWDDGEFQYALAVWTPDSHNEKGCRTPI